MAVVETFAAEPTPAGPAAASNLQVGHAVEDDSKNSSLYVGDLDKDVLETDLFELFSEYGPVHSVRVCRDTVTRRSLGYAYVNFNTTMDPEAAKHAKARLNYHVLKGKAIRIMWTNKNARTRINKSGNVFIKNLEKTVTTRELHDTFAEFGEILSCKVAVDQDGASKGYGFIQFAEPCAAKMAIENVNGAQLGESDKVVTVTEYLSKHDRSGSKQLFTNVYVKNLPESVKTEDDVKAMFGAFGDISSVALMKTKSDEESGKVFAFVNFETHEAAAAACAALHEKEVQGRKLYVDRAQTKEERQGILQRRHDQTRSKMVQMGEGKNVYVKNLAPCVDEQSLKATFSKFGEISSVKVMRDPESNKSRGFGFVCFAETSAAETAVSQMESSHLEGKQLYVAFAQPKAVRAHQLQSAIGMSSRPGEHVKSPLPGAAAMAYGQRGMGYPMGHFMGRGILPGNMYSQMQQQTATRGQNVPNMAAVNSFGPMMNPMMPMMHMHGPGMMSAAGFRSGRGSGRGAPPGRGAMRPIGRGNGPRGAAHVSAQHLYTGQDGLSKQSLAGRLANMPDEDRKQHLGEMLFPRLKGMLFGRYKSDDIAEKIASKVTGMMLEMPAATILYILETETECRIKLDEALSVLRDHGALPEGVTTV